MLLGSLVLSSLATLVSAAPALAEASKSSSAASVIGDYQLTPDHAISIGKEGDRLTVALTDLKPTVLEPVAGDDYRAASLEASLSFGRDSTGRVTRLTVRRYGESVIAPRIGADSRDPGASQSQADSHPEAQSIVQKIDSLVPGLMIALHVPGVSIAGIDEHRVAWHREYGIRCAGRPERVNRDTVFEACSMSKPVFAYVAMKLVEAGKLELDTSLASYLGKPYIQNEPRHKVITARMVLSHTTGFPNWREGGWRKGGPLPLLFKPGEKFGYSGEGFLYLQRVVEQITGQPMEPHMRTALLEPLDMTLSSYVWQERFEKLAAGGHDRQGRLKDDRRLFRRANAGYSLYTSPSEYAQFLVEVMKEDRSAAHSLSRQSIDAMLTRTTKATGRQPITRGGKTRTESVYWGLGWPIDRAESGDRIYHGGANGTGFRCYSEFDRERGTGIVIMTNSLNGDSLWRKLIAAVGQP